MLKRHFLFLIYLSLAIILFLGTYQQRLHKAFFLNNTIYLPFINTLNKIENLFNVEKKNRFLENQLAQEVVKTYLLEQELENLEDERIIPQDLPVDYLLADIIGYRGNFEERLFVINKGKKDGIRNGYPVITEKGIVGKILTTSWNFAVVLPYTHSTFSLGVKLKRNDLQGILKSDINGKTNMTLIPLGSDIVKGDEVISSNLSSIFPEGFKVGTVDRISEAPDKIHMNAHVQGAVNIARLDAIIVLKFERDISFQNEFENNN